MEDKDIIEGNALIAPFDGGYIEINGPNFIETWTHKDMSHILWEGWYTESLEYHSSWDWLMTVVEKIELIEDDQYGRFEVHIYSNVCCIQSTKDDLYHRLPLYMSDPNAILNTKLESTYYNVVSFIKWYSQHKQVNP